MRGLASASKISVPLDNIFEQDPAERDPSSTRESFNYFADLARAFPDSPYTPDAIERMKGLKNTLAAHELVVADYYMRREAYVAAADRAKYVVEYFNESTAVPRALGIMVKAYRELHMADLADDTLKVLQLNYPDELEEMELEPEG
jgi:outer membrane protein assembly factor BamD